MTTKTTKRSAPIHALNPDHIILVNRNRLQHCYQKSKQFTGRYSLTLEQWLQELDKEIASQ